MTNVSSKKIYIQIESAKEQQENIKNQRKTLKVLQNVTTDKENLAGRQPLDKLSRLKASADATLASVDYSKRKKIETRTIETQTSPVNQTENKKNTITVEDLTTASKPGEHYFERLAEKRREALETTLEENRSLHERIEGLEEELNTTRKLLEESHSLVEVLTEMLNDNETEEAEHTDDVKDDDSDARSSTTEQEQEQEIKDTKKKTDAN